MPVSTPTQNRLSGGQPTRPHPTAQPRSATPAGLQQGIARSQSFLLSELKPEGYWVGELMVDSTLVSDTVAYHHWNSKVDPIWQKKAVNYIFARQLQDGGWNIYHGGPAEVNATIKAYLALKLAGVPVTDPRMLKAREMARSLGGVPR
ncbi:MAG: squalene--hopene cyclase, partial [Verrucomicrobia bacterium]|nr:squalene--hopene cyclase [Verrucomicrobiota bacterium]